MKALEQENFSLKKELEAQRELTMVCMHAADYNQRIFRLYKILKFSLHVLFIQGCEGGQRRTELESLQQENEALKAQLARLTTQLLEVLQLFFFFLKAFFGYNSLTRKQNNLNNIFFLFPDFAGTIHGTPASITSQDAQRTAPWWRSRQHAGTVQFRTSTMANPTKYSLLLK